MLKIGDFSKLSKISIHTLRNYEKDGLLVPSWTDEASGQRYYDASQLDLAGRIHALSSIGLVPRTIEEILLEYHDSDDLADYLNSQADDRQKEADLLLQQVRYLRAAARTVQCDRRPLHYHIDLLEIPARITASVRETIPAYQDDQALWHTLDAGLHRQQIAVADPSYSLTIFHNEGYVAEALDTEVQKSVKSMGKNTRTIRFREAKPFTAAVIEYEGTYAHMTEISQLLAVWVQRNGYVFNGPLFILDHTASAPGRKQKKVLTRIGFPVTER